MIPIVTTSKILELFWTFKYYIISFLIISVLILICLFQRNTIKNERLQFQSQITLIETINLEKRQKLIDEARELEKLITQEMFENIELKKEKDYEVNRLTTVISDNSNRLQQLTEEAIRADKYNCPSTSPSKVIETFITVPAPKGAGELTAEMAEDFQRLSAECSTKFEQLKNEANILESWAELTENTTLKED